MHKISARATLRTSAGVLLLAALCGAFLKSASRGRDGALLSACFPPLAPRPRPRGTRRNFFPTRNLPTTMRLATGLSPAGLRAPRCVSSPLSRSLFLTLNSRLPHYLPFHRPPPPLVPRSSSPPFPGRLPSFRALYSLGAFYVLLFCPVIIYIPGNIALPLSGGAVFVSAREIRYLKGKGVEKVNVITRSLLS